MQYKVLDFLYVLLIYISVQRSSRFTISEYLSPSSSLVSFKISLPIKMKTCCHCALLCCNYLPTLRQPIENSVNNRTSFAMAKINLERFSLNLLESIMKPQTQSKNSEIVKFKTYDMLGFCCISWSTRLTFLFPFTSLSRWHIVGQVAGVLFHFPLLLISDSCASGECLSN